MNEDTATAFIGRTVGQYRILEFIGRGGMGRVFLGHDTKLRRDVAVKVLPVAKAADPVARSRFVREARMASRVVHPYVATLFDVAESGDELFLIMEYIRGRTLAAALDERTFTVEEATTFAEELVEALAAIHGAGLIHRDLKPSNVMITDHGHVKVMDFGVARAVRAISAPGDGDVTPETTLTDEGRGAGTVLYMSPEQIRGEGVDARSDLFALGDILYESITGVHPFARPSLHETASAILSAPPGGGNEPETLTGSGPLRSIVMRLLEKEPTKRYESAETLLADLRAIRAGVPARAIAHDRALRAWVASALVVVGLVAAVWLGRVGTLRVKSGGGRPGILVLPFEGASADPGDAPRGAMMASLLRADLAGIPAVRVVGSTRTDDLVGLSHASSPDGASGRGLVSLAAVRYLVSGRYATDGAKLRLAVDVYDGEAPDKPTAFVVEGASLASLVTNLDRELRKGLSIGEPSGGVEVAGFGVSSDAALLSAERGRQASDRGDYLTAGREYESAVHDDPEFVRAHLERARVLYDAGFVTRARESVDAASAAVAKRTQPLPEALSLRLAAIRAEVDEKREDEVAVWRRIAASSPDDPDALVDLSDALRRANLNSESLAAVEKAVAARPLDPSILLRKAKMLRLLGKLDEAKSALDAARRAGPPQPTGRWAAMVLIEKGDQARAANRFPEARASYEEARTFLAKAGEPLILASVSRAIGESFTREGKLADAVPYLRGASETFRAAGNRRADAFALDALGATLFQLSRYDEAEATLREAIQEVQSTEGLAPKPMSYLNLASVLTYTGRCAEASAFATQASAIAEAQKDDKRVASAHLQRGAALECEGRFPDAIAAYEATVKTIGPSSPDERAAWALAGIAEVRALRGDLKTALEQADRSVAAQRATNQKLNVAFALVGRARIRRFAGDLGGADADIREARSAGGGADLTPDLRARIDLDAGVAALDAGDLPAAESGFRGAAAAPPAIDLEGFARAGLAESLCRTGRVDAGLVEAKGAASPPSTFAERLEASHALAECLLAAGDKAESAAAARRYLRDAQAAGARWAVVLAAVDLAKASSREGSDAKARGRRALFELIRAAPGGESGGFAHRTVVRDAKKFLGSS